MKKLISLVLAAAMMLGAGSAVTAKAEEEKTYTVGICQLVQHAALDAATQGFMDALTEKLGDNVKFDLQNAQGETTMCSTIVTGFVANEYDHLRFLRLRGRGSDPGQRHRRPPGRLRRHRHHPHPGHLRYGLRHCPGH